MIKKRKLTPNSTNNSSSSSSSSSNSTSKPVPPDVIMAIFSKLPVKTLIRFQCISKVCSNIITSPSFAIIHQPLCKPKPGLLITCPTKLQSSQTFFVADQNGGAATCCLTVGPRYSRYTTQSTNGIVCMDFGICATVCNPSTRQSFTLPFICPKDSPATKSTYFCVNFFGFDPTNKQYKVLNAWGEYKRSRTEYRVYTLGCTKKWRVLQGGPPYYAQRESICINGNIFFRSWISLGSHEGVATLVSFNAETETFRVIPLPRGATSGVETSSLIQVAGRLAIVDYQLDNDDYRLWVLEDYLNEIWTQHCIVFPLYLKKTPTGHNYVVAGSIDTGEILVVPRCLSTPFYVFYCDLARVQFRRVKVSGLPEYDSFDLSSNFVAVTNYVENILPLS